MTDDDALVNELVDLQGIDLTDQSKRNVRVVLNALIAKGWKRPDEAGSRAWDYYLATMPRRTTITRM